jgi:ATP-dependent Clp protease ATP-binding subunit ClpB
MTSNLGSEFISREMDDGSDTISDETREKVTELLKRTFRPEFLNRLDETVLFKPLTKENLTGIIDILTSHLTSRLAEKDLKLVLTPAAKELVIERGYDPLYGARPLKRVLQSDVETLLARTILSGDLHSGDTLTVDAENGELVVR